MPQLVLLRKGNYKIKNTESKENYWIECGTHHIQTVSNKAKTQRTFKPIWFFSDTHSRHKKPKKFKS